MLAVERRHTVCSPIIPLLFVLEGWPSSCLHVERGRIHLLVLTLWATLATAGPQDAHASPVGGAVAASPDALDGVGEEDRCVNERVLCVCGCGNEIFVRAVTSSKTLDDRWGRSSLCSRRWRRRPSCRSCKTHPLVIKQEICALAAQLMVGQPHERQAAQVDHLISCWGCSPGQGPSANWWPRQCDERHLGSGVHE